MSIITRAALASSLLLLGGCGDPASEAPVDLLPGLYDIAATGKSYIEISASNTSGQKCIDAQQAREFALFPMQTATRATPDCTDTVEPRTGNLIKGKRYCRATFRGTDKRVSTYTVQLTTDGFGIIGDTIDHDDGSGGETGPFRVIGQRVGDC